ncbi:MAG: type II toxin-antitoxin system VapC family toxin [Phycisphaerales bacterium]|nr:type II toxin-antitoxin system VapC family toxin [Phycisphaerales bacterium]
MVHLDTSTVVAHLRGNQFAAGRLAAALPEVAVSTIVLAELIFGVRVSARPDENLARLREFVELVDLVVFDSACADAYGSIRAAQRRSGRPVGEADAPIAATALSHRATLVTHNLRHFEGIDGLTIEDWLV